MISLDDDYWKLIWCEALGQARAAEQKGEVPVGAVVFHVASREIVGAGHNMCISSHDPSAHAEIMALRDAGQRSLNYRLPGCAMAVTLEPCIMCSGALFQARMQAVYYVAPEPKTGAAGSLMDVYGVKELNHHTQVQQWSAHTQELESLEAEIKTLLPEFFKKRRADRK